MCTRMNKDMNEYEDYVRQAMASGSHSTFANADESHAAIIARLFFSRAHKTIRVFCGKMRGGVYGTLGDIVKLAINNGVDVKFLTEEKDVESPELADIIKKKGAWKVIKKEQLQEKVHDKILSHFILTDGNNLRIETDRECAGAVVCVNIDRREFDINRLEHFFDEFWNNYSEVPAH